MLKKLFPSLFAAPQDDKPAKEDNPIEPSFVDGDFSTQRRNTAPLKARLDDLKAIRPKARAVTVPKPDEQGLVAVMDDADCDTDELADAYGYAQPNITDAIALWYSAQTFIGHQLAAIIAQHWLIDKVCDMPGRDAIRHGFEITSATGEPLKPAVLQTLKRADKKFQLRKNLREFIHFGRVFGIRICIFKVDYGSKEQDDRAYALPFNIDGVRPGSYKGMVQVDPYWCSPQLDAKAASQPDSMHFYEPTHWLINGRLYHRSHLVIYRHGAVADILKPAYLYGGKPVPQLIMERVYGAERTANEAPLLALTKRTVVYKVDMSTFMANLKKGLQRIAEWAMFWNNNGVRVIDTAEEHQQIDTSLADLDSVIMTQYQLVAAGGEVPSTKLLGTAPKGFNSTGEFDESSYHETLESLQEHELTPFVERHHAIALRSEMPVAREVVTSISWEPLDSPTAVEWADINLKRAQTDAAYVAAGVLDGTDVRTRLAGDKDSGYTAIDVDEPLDESMAAAAVKAGVSPLGAPDATVEAQK